MIKSVTLHISGTIHHDSHLWYTCVKWYLQAFFHFFKILIFQVFRVVKVQKIVQNDKKFCPSCSISQELYIIWLLFMVHMCKMILSPGNFFIFSRFWFLGLLWVNNYICHAPYLRNCTSSNHDFWCTYTKSWYLQEFFHFFKILIFQAVRGVKGQKMA